MISSMKKAAVVIAGLTALPAAAQAVPLLNGASLNTELFAQDNTALFHVDPIVPASGNLSYGLGAINVQVSNGDTLSFTGLSAYSGDKINIWASNLADGVSIGLLAAQSGVDLKQDPNSGNDLFTISIPPHASNSLTIGLMSCVNIGSATCDNTADFSISAGPDLSDCPPVPTPEPASMALLGVGLVGLAGIRRRLTNG